MTHPNRQLVVAALRSVVASTTTLYHGSDKHKEPELKVNDGGMFGGVFAHVDISGAGALGAGDGDLYEVTLKDSEILTQYEMSYHLDHDKIVAILKKEWPDANQELLHEAVVEDADIWTSEFDQLVEELPGDRGEAAWKAQRLRGVIAKEFGYKAVEMDDERGTSYLILPPTVLTRVEEEE